MKSIFILTAAAFVLAGCGGGGGIPLPTTQNIGTLPGGLVATYDGVADEVVLTIDGVEVATLPNNGALGSVFQVYTSGTDQVLHTIAPSGGGEVFVITSPTADLNLAGIQLRRIVETALPGGGSATYTGNYAGFFVNSNLELITGIVGDVELTADFASASISGEIINRFNAAFVAGDVVLAPTAITSTGAFAGTATGGGIVGQTVSLGGGYSGLIVGSDGTDVVGGLVLSHQAGLEQLSEIGGFSAEE